VLDWRREGGTRAAASRIATVAELQRQFDNRGERSQNPELAKRNRGRVNIEGSLGKQLLEKIGGWYRKNEKSRWFQLRYKKKVTRKQEKTLRWS